MAGIKKPTSREILSMHAYAALFTTAKRWKLIDSMPADRRIIEKQNVYTHHGIAFSLNKEGNFNTCYNIILSTLC